MTDARIGLFGTPRDGAATHAVEVSNLAGVTVRIHTHGATLESRLVARVQDPQAGRVLAGSTPEAGPQASGAPRPLPTRRRSKR